LFAGCRHVPCLFSSFSVAQGVCKYVFVEMCLCIYSTATMLSFRCFQLRILTTLTITDLRHIAQGVAPTDTTGTTPIYHLQDTWTLRISTLQPLFHPPSKYLSKTGSATSSVSPGSLPRARGEPGRSAGASTTSASAKPGLPGRDSTLESRSPRTSGPSPWGIFWTTVGLPHRGWLRSVGVQCPLGHPRGLTSGILEGQGREACVYPLVCRDDQSKSHRLTAAWISKS
jgi:hypothetical protein